MDAEEINTPPSHRAVAEVIRRWLALGFVAPGDRLPTERELSEQLGVGRMTVRHAVRLLADEGLVTTTRGRTGGSFVLDDADAPRRPAQITSKLLRDVRDNFDFRIGVEPMAAELAARRADATERELISSLAAGNATSARVFRALDSRFHLAIAEISRNDLILDAIRASRTEFFRWADAAWQRLDWSALSPEERDFAARHRPVADAIHAGHGDLAAQRMKAHLEEGRRQYLEAISDAIVTAPAARKERPGRR